MANAHTLKEIKLIICLSLIAIIIFSAFLPCLQNHFVNWDDNVYVTQNRFIKSLSGRNLKRIFTTFHEKNYHPLSLLSYALEYRFFKLNPFPYHLTNLILHLINSLLVFWLILIFTKNSIIAFITALLFGIHPLHVESVAWISERRDVLYSLFFLGSLIYYLYYKRNNLKTHYFLSLFLFILAVLSKAMAVTLPFLLLLGDYLLHRKFNKGNLLNKIPFFAIAFIGMAVSFFARYASGEVNLKDTLNFSHNLYITSYDLLFYLGKTLLPIKLSCLYPYSMTQNLLVHSPCLLILAVFAVMIVISARYTRKIIFGTLFFLVTILPVLRFMPVGEVTAVADRYTYIPLIGIFYVLAEGINWLYIRMKGVRLMRAGLLIVSGAIISTLAILTWQRCRVWKDPLSLWNNVLENYPNLAMAYSNRGMSYLVKKEYDKAHSDFIEALKIGFPKKRRNVYLYLNLVMLFRELGKGKEAIEMAKKAIEVDPADPSAYLNLAYLYDTLGNKKEAESFYKKTLELNPDWAQVYYFLGNIYDNNNQTEEAIKMFKKAIEVDPHYLLPYEALGRIEKAR